MKDAKGHGSNARGGTSEAQRTVNQSRGRRGTTLGYAGRDAQGRTYVQALTDHDRFPKQNPTMPNAEDYRTPAAALAQGGAKSAPVPVHSGAAGRSDENVRAFSMRAESPSCPACGGDGGFLGGLGNREHFRCINCGMDFSRRG